ncbi:MAG: hypothetical protein OXN44_01630 [Acidimicrobiaceae bacterium]|nr:hypothetical protein [Acidimicrobiaceae bacterium]MDE0607285.1 hypothetical protein [Acidimicrobiaceae bacterium]
MTSTPEAQPERVDGETLYEEYLEIFHEHSQRALVDLARDARQRMAPPPRTDFEVVTTPSLSLLLD